ncbi:hypothetical protein ACGFS9_30445 [Streptomyces sp. NPDC048566]|uniref:hypothetical protein n=1 Tax=Streptomyces sp. NPDC048566 TaxID=3365569 RepID=UPI00372254F8
MVVGGEALRCLLVRRGITFQGAKGVEGFPGLECGAKVDRIERVLEYFVDRVVAFDGFGPFGIRPTAGSWWVGQGRPEGHPVACHCIHGVRYFHGCYLVGDTLWGVKRS